MKVDPQSSSRPLAEAFRWLLAAATVTDGDERTKGAVSWCGEPLTPTVYHGAVRRWDRLSSLMSRALRGDQRDGQRRAILVVDSDELAGALRDYRAPTGVDILVLSTSLEVMEERASSLNLGEVDAVVVLFETTTVSVAGRGRPQELSALPLATRIPWLFIGLGAAGYRDPWLRELRYWGRPLTRL